MPGEEGSTQHVVNPQRRLSQAALRCLELHQAVADTHAAELECAAARDTGPATRQPFRRASNRDTVTDSQADARRGEQQAATPSSPVPTQAGMARCAISSTMPNAVASVNPTNAQCPAHFTADQDLLSNLSVQSSISGDLEDLAHADAGVNGHDVGSQEQDEISYHEGPRWLQTRLPRPVVGRFLAAMGVPLDADIGKRLQEAAQEHGKLHFSDFFQLYVRGKDKVQLNELRCASMAVPLYSCGAHVSLPDV
jgi:hypothetical protein